MKRALTRAGALGLDRVVVAGEKKHQGEKLKKKVVNKNRIEQETIKAVAHYLRSRGDKTKQKRTSNIGGLPDEGGFEGEPRLERSRSKLGSKGRGCEVGAG